MLGKSRGEGGGERERERRAEVVPVRDVVGCVVSAVMFPLLHFLSNYSFYSFL